MHALRAVERWAARRPLSTSLVVTSAKAAAADALVQVAVERTELRRLDWTRTALFGLFGLGYQGGFQYFFLNRGFEAVWPGTGLRQVVAKVAAANLISDPVFFFPTFYTLKEVLNTRRLGLDSVGAALRNYRANCLMDWRNSWMVWVPGHVVTYTCVPPHLRMPWIAAASFGYVCALSATRGKYDVVVDMPPLEREPSGRLLRRRSSARVHHRTASLYGSVGVAPTEVPDDDERRPRG